MTTILILSLGLGTLWSLKSMNPIKVSISVLLMSMIMFFLMSLTSNLTWFPIILFMLFMGGIIMMFMILSSILPNEKSLKTKKALTILVFMILMTLTSHIYTKSEGASMSSKSFLMSSLNFFIMMSVILFYFLASMSLLSAEQAPMRSVSCY